MSGEFPATGKLRWKKKIVKFHHNPWSSEMSYANIYFSQWVVYPNIDALGQIVSFTQASTVASSIISHLSEPSSLSLYPRSEVIFGHSLSPVIIIIPRKEWEIGFGCCSLWEPSCLSSRCYSISSESDSVPGDYSQSLTLEASADWRDGGVGGRRWDKGQWTCLCGEPGANLSRVQPGNLRAGFVSTSSWSLSAVSVENCWEAYRADCVVPTLGIISSC